MLCLRHPRTQLALLTAKALLTHVQLAIAQDPQVPFPFQHLIPHSIHTTKVAPSQVQIMLLNNEFCGHSSTISNIIHLDLHTY